MNTIYAVVADIKNKEHFIEMYYDAELYEKGKRKKKF